MGDDPHRLHIAALWRPKNVHADLPCREQNLMPGEAAAMAALMKPRGNLAVEDGAIDAEGRFDRGDDRSEVEDRGPLGADRQHRHDRLDQWSETFP